MKKKYKKNLKLTTSAFTLIELLAVLIILGVILAIIIPVTNGVINNSKQNAYDTQIEMLLSEALKYSVQNNLGTDLIKKPITFQNLISNGLISEIPTNPLTGNELEGCIMYIWNPTINQYDFEYDVKCGRIITNDMVSGAVFQSKIEDYRSTLTAINFYSTKSGKYDSSNIKFNFSVIPEDEAVIGYIEEVNGKQVLNIESSGKIIAHEQLGGNCTSGVYESMFCRLINVEAINFNNSFDTTNTKDMSYMFSNNSSLTNLDLSSFTTSNVINMSYMFQNVSKLTSLNLNNLDTSNVINMTSMFYSASKLASLDLSSFDTSNVTSMSWMFTGTYSLTTLNLSNFNTSNVTYMSGMFNASSIESVNLSSFNTSNVTDMSFMFSSTENLNSLSLSNFDYSSITEIGCYATYNPREDYLINTYVPTNLQEYARSCAA